jgi:(2R)-ethylmalonyl-CoA mutase
VAAAVGAAGGSSGLRAVAERSRALPGGPPRLLVAKPGLDGHSNGAEQIAVAARDAGMEVIYQGIRLTPEQIAAVAVEEDVDVIGLSILSGSHLELVPGVVRLVREGGVDAPVIAGGIIPEEDRQTLLDAGVAAVYTPKDFELVRIMGEVLDLAAAHRG